MRAGSGPLARLRVGSFAAVAAAYADPSSPRDPRSVRAAGPHRRPPTRPSAPGPARALSSSGRGVGGARLLVRRGPGPRRRARGRPRLTRGHGSIAQGPGVGAGAGSACFNPLARRWRKSSGTVARRGPEPVWTPLGPLGPRGPRKGKRIADPSRADGRGGLGIEGTPRKALRAPGVWPRESESSAHPCADVLSSGEGRDGTRFRGGPGSRRSPKRPAPAAASGRGHRTTGASVSPRKGPVDARGLYRAGRDRPNRRRGGVRGAGRGRKCDGRGSMGGSGLPEENRFLVGRRAEDVCAR